MISTTVKTESSYCGRDTRKQAPAVIESALLFDKQNEVLIAHQGEQYRLRRTRNGKLILTK